MSKALLVSGLGQETHPHAGLKKFADTYLGDYVQYFTSYKDQNLHLEDIDIAIGHSFGAIAIFRRLEVFRPNKVIKVVFWDTVDEHWNRENIAVDQQVHGVSVIKIPGWLFRRLPPSCDVKGPNMQTMKYPLDHNEIVKNDDVQRDVATVLGLI